MQMAMAVFTVRTFQIFWVWQLIAWIPACFDVKGFGVCAGTELTAGGADEPAEAVNNGFELSIPADANSGTKGKVLGSREFARFYKQRPRLDDTRQSVAVNKVLARYQLLYLSAHAFM